MAVTKRSHLVLIIEISVYFLANLKFKYRNLKRLIHANQKNRTKDTGYTPF